MGTIIFISMPSGAAAARAPQAKSSESPGKNGDYQTGFAEHYHEQDGVNQMTVGHHNFWQMLVQVQN